MYFTLVWILLLILISLGPHYNPNLVSLHLTLVWHLWPNSDHLWHSPPLTPWGKLGTQTFRKGATHKSKPSPLLRSDYWRPMTELLSPRVVMSEGLGFNFCVAPFLNVCALNLLQRVGDGVCWRWLVLGWRCRTRVGWRETKSDCGEDKG